MVLGGDVEADGGTVGLHGLQVLDHVALAGVRGDLAEGEVRCAVAARGFQERGLPCGIDAADEAEAAGPGELAVDVAGQAVVPEAAPCDPVLAGGHDGSPRAAEPVFVLRHAFGDHRCHPEHGHVQPLRGDPGVARLLPGRGRASQDEAQDDQRNQGDARCRARGPHAGMPGGTRRVRVVCLRRRGPGHQLHPPKARLPPDAFRYPSGRALSPTRYGHGSPRDIPRTLRRVARTGTSGPSGRNAGRR